MASTAAQIASTADMFVRHEARGDVEMTSALHSDLKKLIGGGAACNARVEIAIKAARVRANK